MPETTTASKDRLREVLEEAMEDVAMLMADTTNYQARLMEVRQRCAEVWAMGGLGEVPEYEVQAKARRVS